MDGPRCLVVWLLLMATLAVGEDLPPLRFGIPPWQKAQSLDELRQDYQPLLTWLGERIGRRFILVGGRSYEDMIDLVARGEVDLAELSPVPYVQAKKKNPELQLLLTEVKWNDDHTALIDSYRGHIIVRDDRKDLLVTADLRGKRLGFVNHESSSGWRYPRALLAQQGLDATRDATPLFLGSHPRVTDAVAAGSVDAGATWDFNLAAATRKHGAIFRILVTTPPIPNLCLVAEPQVPPAIVQAIRQALPQAPQAVFARLPMHGYVERPDNFYDVVRNLIASEDAESQPPVPVK
jgi:phosphonate transport system substrate-binding protein